MSVLDGLLGLRPTPSQRFVQHLMEEPLAADVAWLGALVREGEEDHARWELRYAKRAIGLIVAQRDALDDRTASVVAHDLQEAMRVDRAVAAPMIRLAERQFNERLGAYREMAALRGGHDAVADRIARTMLMLAGIARANGDDSSRATALVAKYFLEAGDALRASFSGAAITATPTGTTTNG